MSLNWQSKVTVLVTPILILATFSALAAEKTPALTGSFKMASMQLATAKARPVAAFGTGVEYNPFSTYAIGVDLSLIRSYHQMDYQAAKGFEDVLVYAMNKELWRDRYNDITVTAKLGWIFPTSEASQVATMQGAAIQFLSIKKGITGRLSLTYGFSATEYAYNYESFEYEDEIVYNTRYRLVNRVTLSYDITRKLHFDFGGSVRHYSDYEDDGKYNIYGLMTGISYDVHKQASLDFGITTASMDDSEYTPWAGPAVSRNFFGSSGVIFMIGTSLRI